MIVMQILLRTKYDETDKVGIRRLLNDNTYLACFPLHEGSYNLPDTAGNLLDRHVSIDPLYNLIFIFLPTADIPYFSRG